MQQLLATHLHFLQVCGMTFQTRNNYNTLQLTATHAAIDYNSLQHTAGLWDEIPDPDRLEHDLGRKAEKFVKGMKVHIAAHCNTLQLQHIDSREITTETK